MNFAEEMARLPEPPDGPWPHWDHWRHDLWHRGTTEPPENFTTWPCIYHPMLVEHWHSQMDVRWMLLPERYRKVVDLAPAGPLRYNAIEQAYHLYAWESHTDVEVGDLDSIIEFGAGFGQMCWLCRQLGFKGSYTIIDLPEFSLLQRWWLGQQGIEATWGTKRYADLFIGCYSVSEIPPGDREEALGDAVHYLLVYSDNFGEWDNAKWFRKWGKDCLHKLFDDRPDWYLLC